jgi:peptidoglycan DL-endopeptidase CwlS
MATQGQHPSGDQQHTTLLMWWLVPLGLVVALLAVGAITVASLSGAGGGGGEAEQVAEAATRKLPPYWIVKAGDTYSHIAEKTGLTIDDLETFNPTTDPTTIAPGQRLKLRLHVPKVRPRLGPRFWTVRQGQSFGSIAARTGKPIGRLIALNLKLKPSALQVGDRVRLRR